MENTAQDTVEKPRKKPDAKKQAASLAKRDAREAAQTFLADVKAVTFEVKAYLDLVDNEDVDITAPETGKHARALVERLKNEVSAFPLIREAFESMVLEAKGYRDYFAAIAKSREAAFERFKMVEAADVIKEAKKALNKDEPSVKGSYGSVWMLNSTSVVFSWGEDGKVSESQIAEFGIDEKYIKTSITKTIDKDKVKADLKDLVEISWAAVKEKATPTGKLNTAQKSRLERKLHD